MSAATLKFLRETYGPERYGLRAEEVARALGKKDGRGALQRVRERMKNGRYPNAKKVDGIWQLPVDVLAEIMEPSPVADPNIPPPGPRASTGRTGRRKSEIGPRLDFIRAGHFWVQVFRAMGSMEDAQELEEQVQAARMEGWRARDIARSDEQHGGLDVIIPPATGPSKIRNPI